MSQAGRFDRVFHISAYSVSCSETYCTSNLSWSLSQSYHRSYHKVIAKLLQSLSRSCRDVCRKVCREVVAKLLQSCRKVVAKLSQSCRNFGCIIYCKSCRKVVARLSQSQTVESWSQILPKFMSLCCQSPWGKMPLPSSNAWTTMSQPYYVQGADSTWGLFIAAPPDFRQPIYKCWIVSFCTPKKP